MSVPCILDLPYTPSQLEGATEQLALTELPAGFLVVGVLLPAPGRWPGALPELLLRS